METRTREPIGQPTVFFKPTLHARRSYVVVFHDRSDLLTDDRSDLLTSSRHTTSAVRQTPLGFGYGLTLAVYYRRCPFFKKKSEMLT